jgi:DNA-binding NarL/FixJ family response regulator
MSKLRILLADDHIVIRQGLRLLINSQPDMEVIGDAGDGRSAIQQTLASKPDLVVMDVSMPELNGQQATLQLKKALPMTKVLALTRHKDTSYLRQLLTAGVDGYVLKQSDSDELLRAIRTIATGGKYIDPAVTDKIVDSYTGRATNRKTEPTSGLSERESEVLRLIALGHTNKEIASRFDLSIKTVEAHKANAMRKLDLQSRVDIIRYAILRGWLQDS